MATDRSNLTFEEFIQSTMSAVDRVLTADRASENRLMLGSRALGGKWRQLPNTEDAPG